MCGGGIALVGFRWYGLAKQVVQEVGPELVSMGELLHEAQAWIPPSAEAGPEEVFPLSVTATSRPRPGQPNPQMVTAWKRTGHDDSAAIPELALDQDGRHARYEANGAAIDVCIYRVAASEQAQVFSDAVSALQGAGYSSQTHQDYEFDEFDMVRWMTFSFSPPERHGRMLWVKDWLIVTMTDRAATDVEGFERAYLRGIQGKGVAASEDETPTDEPVSSAEQRGDGAASTEPEGDVDADTAPDNPDAALENPDATESSGVPRG